MLSSTRRGISYPNPDRSDAPDIPLHIKNLVDALELDVFFTQDITANRPISTPGSPGKIGRVFFDTTTSILYWDYGTGWQSIGALGTDSVSNAMLQDNSVDSSNIAADAVGSSEIATDAVTNVEIAAGAVGTSELADGAATAAKIASQVQNVQTGAYTLVLSDRFKMIREDSASPVNITIPTNATQNFAVGDSIDIIQWGAGQVTLVAAGSVALVGNPGLKLIGQYTMATVIKIATDTWLAVGALTP